MSRSVGLLWRHGRLEKVLELDHLALGLDEPFVDERGFGRWRYALRCDPKNRNRFLLNYHYSCTMRGSVEVPEITRWKQ